MSPRSRDPRKDPIPGDEISRDFPTSAQGAILRMVTRAHGGFVFFRRDNGYTAKNMIVHIDKWRKWAEKAEIVETGVPQ